MRADRITDVQNPNCFLYTRNFYRKILMEPKPSARFDDCRFYSNFTISIARKCCRNGFAD